MTSSLSSFAYYKNVNISETKKDVLKRKTILFFTLKSLSPHLRFIIKRPKMSLIITAFLSHQQQEFYASGRIDLDALDYLII